MNVRLTKEQKIRILNSNDMYAIMQQVLLRENKIRRNQEHFWVVGLNNKNKILFIELVSLGSVNGVRVSPTETFRMAIYKLAVNIILVHNHPSGDLKPSQEDLDLTDRLMKSGTMLNINVLDHLIISENEFYSFANEGILARLQISGKYQLIDREKNYLKNYQKELLHIEKRKATELAKKMFLKKYPIPEIVELTGVKEEEIKKFN